MEEAKTEKTKWTNVNIPVVLSKRIRKIMAYFGYTSVADYVAAAIRQKLRLDRDHLLERSID